MSTYIKFLKDILFNKCSLGECKKAQLNLNYIAILSGTMSPKMEDPEKFTIPYILEKVSIKKALYDLRASMSLVPCIIFERMCIGELKPT
jgi:hypothetical protein